MGNLMMLQFELTGPVVARVSIKEHCLLNRRLIKIGIRRITFQKSIFSFKMCKEKLIFSFFLEFRGGVPLIDTLLSPHVESP